MPQPIVPVPMTRGLLMIGGRLAQRLEAGRHFEIRIETLKFRFLEQTLGHAQGLGRVGGDPLGQGARLVHQLIGRHDV